MENVRANVNVPADYNGKPIILHFLEGDAPDAINPVKPKQISGDINSVATFLANTDAKSTVDPKKAIIICNHTNGSISLNIDDTDELAKNILGTLNSNADLDALRINKSGVEYSIPDLRKALKFAGPLFSERTAHTAIMKKLESIRVKFEQEIVDETDGKGNENKANKITTQIDQGLTEGFDLLCPLFDGQPPLKFHVDIVFSAEGRKLTCWFESVELKEKEEDEMKRIMSAEKTKFAGFVVIDQY